MSKEQPEAPMEEAQPKRDASATTESRQRSLANLIPFKPGQSGNPRGRMKGSRHKLAEAFLSDLYAMWEEHGPAILLTTAMKNPVDIAKLVATVLPRDFQATYEAGPTFRDLLEAINAGKLPPREPLN
jgi:hypothetical protein